MAYNLTLNNQQLQLSLARTGGQGSQPTVTAAPTPDTVLGTYVITVETHYTNYPGRSGT